MSDPNLYKSVETRAGQDSDPDNESDEEQVYYNVTTIIRPQIEADDNPRPIPPPRRRNTVRSEQLTILSPPSTGNIPHRVSVSAQQSSTLEEGFDKHESDGIPAPTDHVTVAAEYNTYVVCPTDRVQNGVQEDLNDCGWYWGDISRGDAEQMLKDNSDGSFLVRDSTTPRDYTLTVRKDGQSKCLKLYQKDDRFGLKMNECTFRCLSALIEHYTRHSLAEFNRRLDTKLNSYPPKTRGKRSGNYYESLSSLADIGRQLQKARQQYIALKEKQVQCNQMLEDSQLRERVLETARAMFSQLLAPSVINDNLVVEEDLSLNKKEMLEQNKRLVTERQDAIDDKINNILREMSRFENELNNVTIAINYQVEVLRDAEENCEKIRMQVLEEGAKKELVECLVEESDAEAPDRSLWLVECTRDEANDYLKNERTGTFLIRPKHESADKPYALSIVSGNEDGSTTVKHCVIHHPPGRGYGFRDDGAVFESIDELVCKHGKTTIKVYFAHMDTCLDHPLLGKRPRSSGEIDGNRYFEDTSS